MSERRFILLFEVLPIDDKDDYYAESARPRVKRSEKSDVITCKSQQHPLYYYYTINPKENLPCITRSTTLNIIKSLPLARRRRTLTLFYDFTTPASEHTSISNPSSKTSIHLEDRDRSDAINIVEKESRSRRNDTRRPTTLDSSLEASSTENYDDHCRVEIHSRRRR